MKLSQALLLVFFVIMLPQTGRAQAARDYFNELYKAGGLDKTADEFVCFDDRPNLSAFFIYADYSNLKERVMDDGKFAQLPQSVKEALSKGFLIVREYNRGVAHPEEDFYRRDGNTWATDPFTVHSQQTQMRSRLNIAQQTLRYERKIEILNSGLKVINEVLAYGRCESVPTTVPQKGN